ncbi:hypothetical protein ACGGZK_05025 [Agromyces sp. MMS24-K17]|uniref:hypothetical protein n=1 Tax=Agromyces sp. MMS24-K17 TaxID=3372850 RepID=UPI003754690A
MPARSRTALVSALVAAATAGGMLAVAVPAMLQPGAGDATAVQVAPGTAGHAGHVGHEGHAGHVGIVVGGER